MNPYEIIATVAEEGQLVLPGTPFEPGTEVVVTVRPIVALDADSNHFRSGLSQESGGLIWKGNVLVHHGTSPELASRLARLRDERLDQLTSGLPE